MKKPSKPTDPSDAVEAAAGADPAAPGRVPEHSLKDTPLDPAVTAPKVPAQGEIVADPLEYCLELERGRTTADAGATTGPETVPNDLAALPDPAPDETATEGPATTAAESDGNAAVTPPADRPEAPEGAEDEVPASRLPPPPPSAPPKAPAAGGSGGGSFAAALIGGVVAAALGAGVTLWVLPEGWRQPAPDPTVAAQAATLQKLGARIETLEAEAQALKSAATTDTGAEMSALDQRIAALEAAPAGNGDSGGAPEQLASLQSAIAELQGRIEAQQDNGASDIAVAAQAAARAAEDRLKAAEAEAERLRSETEAAARAARGRAALSHLLAALETGAPLAPALSDLQEAGLTPPAALADAGAGVPTLARLQAQFPDAARAGLAASLPVTAGTGFWDRASAFLQAQTGARSLEPRAGSDPDAVLSRAQAAVTAGELPTALTELQALPAEGQAAMADWVKLAQARIDALAAAAAIDPSAATASQ